MRYAFRDILVKLAEKDKNIYLLVGDLGFSVVEPFIEKFPERFINCGVAEQNMIGVAAGLALSGKKPYVFSIVPFVTMRCIEQIRNDVCYQNLDVKIIGVGGGFSYGDLGATHHAIEDIAILRALPNMTVLCPADPLETEELVLKSYQTKNPTYIRLGRGGEKTIYDSKPELEIGKPSVLREGEGGVIIGTGPQVELCLEAVEKLKSLGYNFKLLSFHTLKPIDKESFLNEVNGSKKIFTVEEHNVIGGLGSAVAETLAESDWQGTIKIIGVLDEYTSNIGKADFIRQRYQLNPEQITEFILKQIK